ncbi:L,D-transpeptidase family protein [Paenibacillus sp. GYB003]|uniref:L,D-transpeptidase family protein n=1 Tax=Paenibacillus sp. GYB003 TaxID=2994392 RepID=UPI002F96AE21
METPPDDPGYLKNYIKEHPNNKMAWYLLGRQYMAKGEVGKANYCFAQAGEVYQAFEEGTVFGNPAQPDRAADGEQPEEERAVQRKPAKWKTAIVALLLLLGGHIPIRSDLHSAAEAAAEANGPDRGGVSFPLAASEIAPDGFDVVYAVSDASGANRTTQIGELLARFQDKAQTKAESLLLAEPVWSGGRKWLVWPVPAKPIALAEHSNTAAGAHLTYYDARTCQCEPADPAAPAAQYAGWQNAQLQRLVVRSAAAAYESANGKPPDSLDRLVRNYPDNWLSGYTPAMKAYFEAWSKERQSGAAASEREVPAPTSGASPSGSASQLLAPAEALTEPLTVLVDRTTHTLALVSGGVLLRSYPVGLGGDRTPVGEFTITEKVRNPNGRDNGTFGSRGMTLSDTLYAIHGTNQPSSIGKDKSLGCIRMLKPDVEELFDLVPKGTKVIIGDKLGIPAETYRSPAPLRLPSQTDETNPHKTYKWLN